MATAISDEHRALSEVVSDFLLKHRARNEARALLEADTEPLPVFWDSLRELGWLGLHLPETYGGSGFGLPELVVVVEEMGRAVAPGPFVPTVIASAFIARAASPEVQACRLPGLAAGSTVGAVALGGEARSSGGVVSGPVGVMLGGGLADILLVPVGDDVAIVERAGGGVALELPPNLDPTRRAARVTLDGAPAELVRGGRRLLVDLTRTILSAEATGIAAECAAMATAYAGVRQQFGRPIGTFQAVKHHCVNMLVAAELATAALWDAARAGAVGGDQLSLAAAVATTLAVSAADHNAQLNIQVHGGIGFTWEHDAHLYLRRATALAAVLDAEGAATDVTDLVRRRVVRTRSVELPPEAGEVRATVRRFVDQVRSLESDGRRKAMLDNGYAMPHWPRPWGRSADAVEQLVIEEEFAAAGIERPFHGITGWIILTLIQHGTEDQVARWVRPAMAQEVIWCQLFSEPDAGSDAAGVKTRGSRVDGGWLVNGQKVWTSGAHLSRYGLATVRTNPEVAKHHGITTMVIDMAAEGVEIRPLRRPTGGADFNEVFLDNVFVPDDDVVGAVDAGWAVARATLGNESVSIGGGQGGATVPMNDLIAPLDAHPERLAGGSGRVGRHIARCQAMELLNLRRAHRAVAGGSPGPEGAVTKLILSENGLECAAILAALGGPESAFLEGPTAISGTLILTSRGMAIAGGTSEIKRNQIGERILGLPRDPLVR